MTTSEAVVPEPLWRRARGHAVLFAITFVCAFPIYWLLATSLRRPDDVGSLSPVPWPLSLGNYVDATEKVDVIRLLANTFAVAAVSAAGQLLVALLASYAFAMYSFRFQRLLYLAFVGTWLVPFQVTMLPNYVLLYQLGLVNNLAGVIVPTLCSALGVLMLRQHMAGFPKELVAAAKLDGRSSWSILWTVVVPNLRPALAAWRSCCSSMPGTSTSGPRWSCSAAIPSFSWGCGVSWEPRATTGGR